MVNDIEARRAVRELMKRFEIIADQAAGLAYVLARKSRPEYELMLEAAEVAQKIVVGPLTTADTERNQIYQALDDPNADWSKAVMDFLQQDGIVLTGDAAVQRLELMRSLDERFDKEMKKHNGGGGQKERGFGEWT